MELSDGSKVCIDCESLFIIDDGERQYFETNSLTLPKRCKACRQLRRDLAHQQDVERAREVLGVVDIEKQNALIILLDELGEI